MTRLAHAGFRLAAVAICIAASQTTAFSQTTKVAFADHTVRLLDRWSWSIRRDGSIAVLPLGYERKNGMHALTIRRAQNDGRLPIADIIKKLKREYSPNAILDEGTTGLFKHPTRWLVVKDPDARSPGVRAIFVSTVDEHLVIFEYQLSEDRWEHCMSTAIKTTQTLDT